MRPAEYDLIGCWGIYPAGPKPGDTVSLTQTWSGAIGSGKTRTLTTTMSIGFGDSSSGTLYVNDNITTP